MYVNKGIKMKIEIYRVGWLACCLLLSSGCAMCCGVYDQDYLATSDLMSRVHPSEGRVGSVFSDPQAGMTSGVVSSSDNQPTPAVDPAGGSKAPAIDSGDSNRETLGPPSQLPAQSISSPISAAGGRVPRTLAAQPTRPLPRLPRIRAAGIRQAGW